MMKPKYNNILIDAVMHLGDLIHATTLIPLLKQQYPDARISYLVKSELVDLFKNIDNIEYVIPYKYKSKGDYFSVFRMAKEIKKYNFDLSISLDPRLRLSAMMWLAGIPTRVGSESLFGWQAGTERFFFSDYFRLKDYDVKKHSAAENFQYLVRLFLNEFDGSFFVPAFKKADFESITYIEKQLNELPEAALKIVMSVNTVDSNKNIPPQIFIDLINNMARKYQIVIIFAGINNDRIVIDKIKKEIGGTVLTFDLCGKTNLVQLNALFQQVDFLINLDNGMGHFAAGAGCPTVTIFTNSPLVQFKPLHKKTLTVGGSCGCIGECNKNLRETCGFKCLYDISVDMIMEKVDIMVRQLQGQTYEGTMKNEKN